MTETRKGWPNAMRYILPVLLLATWIPQSLCAQSLWDRRDPERAFLFYDTQARHVGDLLTVVINENTDVDNKDQRSLGKETDTRASFNLLHSAAGVFGNSTGKLTESSNTTSNRTFDGKAEFSSERMFLDRFTVTVTDVLPNGNLAVSGRRHVNVGGDRRCLILSGIVRYEDVSPDNTVSSRLISNLQLFYEEKGVETRFTGQGWLGRVTNWLWPF
jgi:flagellar L-ring protein precursor FlgH